MCVLQLMSVLSQLERLKSENTATVAMLSSRLQSLWDRVDASQEDRYQFLVEHSGVSQRVVQSVGSLVAITVSCAL